MEELERRHEHRGVLLLCPWDKSQYEIDEIANIAVD